MAQWRFFVYLTASGRDVVIEWLDGLEREPAEKIKAVLFYQRQFSNWPKNFCRSYEGYHDLYELKFKWKNNEFRMLGFFGIRNGDFTIVWGVAKREKIPKGVLDGAMERIRTVRMDGRRRREYGIYE